MAFISGCINLFLIVPLKIKDLLAKIKESYVASGGVYGCRRVFADLREAGETCGIHRIEKIMKANNIKAIRGYKKPRHVAGRPSIIAPNRLDRKFTVNQPDSAWVTDITYLRNWQGWLYLAVVIDLHSRKVVGWSMKPTLAKGLVLDALLMALWRRKLRQTVIVHSDQGSQYGSDDWQRFCRSHNLEPSMSRRGNCWDNAVAESFFSSLKKERVRKRVYKTRDMARADVFDYIEAFTIKLVVTPIWVASAPRHMNVPQPEAAKCLKFRSSPIQITDFRRPATHSYSQISSFHKAIRTGT